MTVHRLSKAPTPETSSFSTNTIKTRFTQAARAITAAGVDSLFTYPATRLARLSWQKLALRFADEVVLVSLGVLLVIANIFIGYSGSAKNDTSVFATELSRHAHRNTALYTTLFSRTTTISGGTGFIHEAAADEQLLPATPQVAGASITNNSLTTIDEQGLSAAIPDSIKPMLSNQIRIYETKPGDTLSSIAEQYDIDLNTIRWSNGLTSDTIKEGWFLVIPTVKGVLVKADEDTTIPGIARKFKCSEERIISFNGLDGADSVEKDEYIMCPDGEVPVPPKPPVKAAATRTIGVNYASIPDLPGVVNSFVKGNCTWYVAKKMKITFRGNANRWYRNSQAAGYKTGKVPMAGSAVVTSHSGAYGHVAYVESVNADGTFNISEMNYKGLGVLSYRKDLSPDDVIGFIYPD